jgi:uncharacterized protein
MIDKNKTYAIIGATDNEQKYGFKVFENLLDKGFDVIPINPRGGEILGQKVYTKLEDVKRSIDVVVFVVPPDITQVVLLSVKKLGIKNVFLQPGSQSEQTIGFCKENGIECTHHACIMQQN